MKVGPTWFTCTLSTAGTPAFLQSLPIVGSTMTYYMQNFTATITSVPIDARGGYNKSFQLVGTLSAVSNVAIDVSLDPQTLMATTGTWYTIGNLSTPTFFLVHSGNIRSVRARTVAIGSGDTVGVLYMLDDAG